MKTLILILTAGAAGCVGIPEGVTAVDGFKLDRYLGTWYEIARLDHSFERGLSHVSATYTALEGGAVSVVNRGYDRASGAWREAEGTAYFVEEPTVGRLKVCFFWPFYGGYNVIALDKENYSHALVCGNDRSYLWVLARERELPAPVLNGLLQFAEDRGFAVKELIIVDQKDPPPGG